MSQNLLGYKAADYWFETFDSVLLLELRLGKL